MPTLTSFLLTTVALSGHKQTLTFSLALSSSNICWISSLQSSCKEWNDSRGIWNMADCSMANSRLRMLVKEGLLWGFGLQHSDHKTSLYFKLTTSMT